MWPCLLCCVLVHYKTPLNIPYKLEHIYIRFRVILFNVAFQSHAVFPYLLTEVVVVDNILGDPSRKLFFLS